MIDMVVFFGVAITIVAICAIACVCFWNRYIGDKSDIELHDDIYRMHTKIRAMFRRFVRR